MNTPRQTLFLVLVSLFGLSGTATLASAQDRGARAIEGVWAMSITLRDCATQAPLGPPLRTLLTFHAGGTLGESPGTSQFAPGQRSNGHGLWSYAGANTFTGRFIAMVIFDTPPAPPAPGFLTGWQLVVSNFQLTDPNRLNVSATVQFFDINRNVYRTACPTGTAERFQ
jgi:hypothetical protein